MYVRTKAQRDALFAVYQDSADAMRRFTFLQFRRKSFVQFGNCVMIILPYIVLGIETDGYTHS